MTNGQNHRIKSVLSPNGYSNNTSPSMTTVDCAGYKWANFRIHLGSTDIALTACKIQEVDAVGDSPSDVTGATLNSGTDIFGNTTSLPSATDDGKIYEIILNLSKRKRYLVPLVTVGNGTAGAIMSVTCELSQGVPLNNTTESGAAAVVVV